MNLSIIYIIRDILFIEKSNGLCNTSLSWANSTVMDRLLNLTVYTDNIRFNSLLKNQLTAGNWVGKVLDDMKAKRNNSQEDIKLYLYSAHDTTVAAMQTALGVFNGELPPYAAAFFIELYSNNGKYFVSLFYRNETDSDDLIPLNVTSCADQTLCTLDEFITHSSGLVLDDWEKACGLKSESNTDTGPDAAVITLGILLGVSLLLLVAVVVGCVVVVCNTRRRHEYTRVPHTD